MVYPSAIGVSRYQSGCAAFYEASARVLAELAQAHWLLDMRCIPEEHRNDTDFRARCVRLCGKGLLFTYYHLCLECVGL